MGLSKTELMPFKKFVESHLRLLYHEKTRKIVGVFRDMKTKEIVEGDIFTAHVVGNCTAEQTYIAYLTWNNYVKEDYEADRDFISAVWGE